MEEHVSEGSRVGEGDYCRALVQIQAAALHGLTEANSELTLADEEADSEGWAMWRGYRRAMLEILAITDKLPLPQVNAAPQNDTRVGDVPSGGTNQGPNSLNALSAGR